jgi:hypothetical protein
MDIASAPFRRSAAAALLALPFALAGCGESVPAAGARHAVKGKVVFSKPDALAGLKVELVPKTDTARLASGDIAPDGSFSLKSADGEDVAEGEYGVRLVKPGGFPKGKFNSPIPQPYFDEDGAFLSTSIKPDTAELPAFELKPITDSTPGSKRRAAVRD